MFQSIKGLMLSVKDKGKVQNFEAFERLEDRLQQILDEATVLEGDFMFDIIPIWAQSVIGLSNKNLPGEIQKIIDNAKEFNREVFLDKRDLMYQELKKRYRKGELI